MPRLSNILNDSAVVDIYTPDGDIHIDYYPSRVTQKMTNQFRSLAKVATSDSATDEDTEKALQKIYGMLLSLTKSWDLDDEVPCGECEVCKIKEKETYVEYEHREEQQECQSKEVVPFPLVAERMNDLPVWLIVKITEALVDPNRQAPQKKKKS
jgi:hypothetical protein